MGVFLTFAADLEKSMMKSYWIHYIAGLILMLIVGVLTACQPNAQWRDYECYGVLRTEHISEPREMDVKIDLQFLKTDKDASAKVCQRINAQLKELLLKQSGDLGDEEAVDLYIDDVKAEFRANEIWEMYSEELTGRVEYGTDHIVNYRLTENSFAGGAHPSSVTTIVRFDAQNGDFISLDNVFPTHRQGRLKELLLRRLMQDVHVSTLEDLRAKGYLEWMDMFISSNFALREDSIEFFYNEYDIAPYAVGACTICLGYDEAKEVMADAPQKEIQ